MTFPLGPFNPDPRYNPRLLIANKDRPTAEQMGWVRDQKGKGGIARYRQLRALTSVEKEVAVLRLFHQNRRAIDIAEELGMKVPTVHATIRRSLKRAATYAGAEKERDRQLEVLTRVEARLLQAIDPGPDETGAEPHVDTKAVAELMKVMTRRAALTGADKPVKVQMDGQITHTVAEETVDLVNKYMDLIDAVQDTGYGSGRKREEREELEPADEDRIIDAEVVEDEADPEPDPEPDPTPEDEVIPQYPPLTLHSVPNGAEPGGDNQ